MSNRLTYEELVARIDTTKMKPAFTEKWFNKNYKNINSTELKFKCTCGNQFTLKACSITSNKYGQQCKECVNVAKRKSQQLSYEKVINLINEQKCKPNFTKKWFDSHYKSVLTELSIICMCGEPVSRKLASSVCCDNCRDKNKKTRHIPYADMIKRVKAKSLKPNFNSSWYKENYKDSYDTVLPVFCKCGNTMEITIRQMRNRKNCVCEECCKESKLQKAYEELVEYFKSKENPSIIDYNWFKTNYRKDLPIPYICNKCKEDRKISLFTIKNYGHSLICRKCQGIKNNKRNPSVQEILEMESKGTYNKEIYL